MDWQEKYALIIDEVGMLGARMLCAVNVQPRRLRESTEDFGDIPVIIFLRGLRPVSSSTRVVNTAPKFKLPTRARPRLRSRAAKTTRRRLRPVEEVHRGGAQGKSLCRARSTTTQTHNACSAGSPGSVGCRVSEQQLLSRGETHSMGVGYRRGDATQQELMEPECRGNTHVPEAATYPSPHLRFRA
ncbi:hypothetical protein FOTG_17316 [Fusarium oxysporum f. sp. vasinfectum 25433]|uniref:Uncharacterized protein n=1 Tax=Fusarium oxysporum f. sp. vasinfectum 25433 TaxID=1089449 RepID=X0L009_FUSOX|nr:hypothetical protein FOTG_17316 [Fusarium oxysporum f. sp. vasinfectum 25433]